MTTLFTQYWDVNPGEYDDHSKFISEEFNPGLEKLGLKLVGGFYVAVGSGPRILAVATMQNGSGLLAALASREYRILSTKLHDNIFTTTAPRSGFPRACFGIKTFSIQTGAWKFNQYYDIVPGMETEHNDYVRNEAIPMMKQLGVPVTHGWRLSIGTGPRILAECTARTFADIAGAVDTSRVSKTVPDPQKAVHHQFQQPNPLPHRPH